jgi:hypothetical protein
MQTRAVEVARRGLEPKDFLEIKYEAFCERPLDTYRQVLEFAELPDSVGSAQQIKAAGIKRESTRWLEDLTPAQRRMLDELLGEDLQRYGYGASR